DGKALVGTVYILAARAAAGAAVPRGHSLFFWDPVTGNELRQITLPSSTSTTTPIGLAVAPDGRTLAAAVSGHPVQIIELATGQVREELQIERPTGVRGGRATTSAASSRTAVPLRFAPDGRTLYT